MSRCFPFPPQGYIRNGARNEALIDSIKLQRELEKSKEDRKKEKKEKKREKKEKKKKEKKAKKLKEGSTSCCIDGKKLKHIDELKETKADGKLQKGEDLENEQFERSGITEEHEQAVSSREPCCLSDSTQSSKRKRSTSPSSSHDNGTAIRIRLPLRKHKEPEQLKPDQCGPSGSLSQGTGGSDHGSQCVVTNAEDNQSLVKSDSKHHKTLQNLNLVYGDAPVTSNRHKETKRMAAMYKSLLQIPLTVEGLDSEEDDDWLFRSDLTETKPIAKKVKSVTDVVQCSTPSLWPRAQYLPDVGIYALPYVVPY